MRHFERRVGWAWERRGRLWPASSVRARFLTAGSARPVGDTPLHPQPLDALMTSLPDSAAAARARRSSDLALRLAELRTLLAVVRTHADSILRDHAADAPDLTQLHDCIRDADDRLQESQDQAAARGVR